MKAMFLEKYARDVNSTDLRDDEHHLATHTLTAAALADLSGGGAILGSMLARVKYAHGTQHQAFESGDRPLAQLVHTWKAVVRQRGIERNWLPIKNEWDVGAAERLYDQVATISLAHWLDGSCATCRGAKVTRARRMCESCGGSGKAQIEAGRLVVERTKDMISELEGMLQAHSGRAGAKMRRAA
jgi:hypothetical protein